MKNIIFIAPPAAGKGTLSKLLVDKYNYVHISTGDLLRNAKSINEELGAKVSEMMSSGKLVSTDIVLDLLSNRIKKDDCKNGFILDGFPRNLEQVKLLMELFKNINVTDYVAVYLDIDYERAMHRTLGRLTCNKCGCSFNKFIDATKPKVDGICDKCGSELVTRVDDTEETFKVRYDTYVKDTAPVVDYFKSVDKLVNVNVSDNPQEMFTQLEKILEA